MKHTVEAPNPKTWDQVRKSWALVAEFASANHLAYPCPTWEEYETLLRRQSPQLAKKLDDANLEVK